MLVLDVARGRVLRALPVAGGPIAVWVDAAAGRLFVTGFDSQTSAGSGAMLDARSGRVLAGAGQWSVTVVADPRTGALYTVDGATDRVLVTTPRAPMARTVAHWAGGDTLAMGGRARRRSTRARATSSS